MEQAVYWLWFAGLFGRGTRLSHEMLEFYGSAEAVFEASEQELRQTALLTRERIARVLGTMNILTVCGISMHRRPPCSCGAACRGWRSGLPLRWWVPGTAMNMA